MKFIFNLLMQYQICDIRILCNLLLFERISKQKNPRKIGGFDLYFI